MTLALTRPSTTEVSGVGADPQSGRIYPAVLFPGHALVEHTFHSRGAQANGRAEPRGSGAAVRCREGRLPRFEGLWTE
jgi:hypothetical protein